MVSQLSKICVIYLSYFVRAVFGVITLPIISQNLSKNDYGQFLIYLSISAWVTIIVEYGFNLSGSRKIAVSTDKQFISLTVSNIIASKIFLSILAILVFVLITVFFKMNFSIALIAYTILQGFLPFWCYQGVGNLHTISIIDIVFKSTHLIFIAYLLPLERKADLFFIIGSFSLCIANIVAYYIFNLSYKLNAKSINFSNISQNLKDGFNIFLFMAITSVYNTASTFILGFYASKPVVADYGLSDKIVKSISGLFGPINNVFFPKSVIAFQISRQIGISFVKKLGVYLVAFACFVYSALYFLAPLLVEELFGSSFANSVVYIQILGLTIVITVLNNILGYHIMFANKLDVLFNKIYVSISIASIIGMIVILPHFSAIGMIFIIVATEILALLAMFVVVFKWNSRMKLAEKGDVYVTN